MTLDISALLERAGLAGLQQIALARIIPNPDNPRRSFEAAEITALAESIREQGLLQPISVFPADEAGQHRIRFGERRYRAAIEVGLSEITAIIADPADAARQLVDQLVENDQRADLSTMELAQAIMALGRLGLSKADIARRLGRAPATISLYAAVPEMPAALQALAGEVTIRPLHDLYRLWRDRPAAVDAFMTATPAAGIDRRTVAAFAATLNPAVRPPPSSTAASPLRPATRGRAAETRHGADRAVADAGHVRIAYAGQEGSLLFQPDAPAGQILVRLDDTETPVLVDAAEVRIIAATPQRSPR